MNIEEYESQMALEQIKEKFTAKEVLVSLFKFRRGYEVNLKTLDVSWIKNTHKIDLSFEEAILVNSTDKAKFLNYSSVIMYKEALPLYRQLFGTDFQL